MSRPRTPPTFSPTFESTMFSHEDASPAAESDKYWYAWLWPIIFAGVVCVLSYQNYEKIMSKTPEERAIKKEKRKNAREKIVADREAAEKAEAEERVKNGVVDS